MQQQDNKFSNLLLNEDEKMHKCNSTLLEFEKNKYEFAMKFCNAYLFEYNAATKKVTVSNEIISLFNINSKEKSFNVKQIIDSGLIKNNYVNDFERIFTQADNNIKYAECEIVIKQKNDEESYYTVCLNSIECSEKNKKFVGVFVNITKEVNLKKEQEFAKNITSDKTLLCEANLTENTVSYIHEEWIKEYNVKLPSLYSKFVDEIANKLGNSFSGSNVKDALSLENILHKIAKGENNFTKHYKFKNFLNNKQLLWYEVTANYIKLNCGDVENIYLRIYVQDINDKKKLNNLAEERRKIYKSMLSDYTLISYEMNLTKDFIIRGNEKWLEENNIEENSKYSTTIADIVDKKVHQDEKNLLLGNAGRQNLLLGFSQENNEFACEYKRLNELGEYNWWSYKAYLYQDPESNDICGFVYIKDINDEKMNEISLIYDAEHDLMTGLYNKITTEKKIAELLKGTRLNDMHSGIILVDLDNFKLINDNFGHAYGDEVIKETSQIIKKEFRQDDVVGRMGGDEFCVFALGLNSNNMLEKKAAKLCEMLNKVYSENGIEVEISASVGIAFVNKNDTEYSALAKRADDAMYRAKKLGKNRVSY